MRIQSRGVYQRLIRASMGPFARRHGFAFVKRTLLGRVHQDTLHIICFEVSNPGFNCTFAVQPLYYPAAHIILNLGRRLRIAGSRVSRSWGLGETEEEISRDLEQVQRLLEADALPWFAQAGTPEGIISFIRTLERKPSPIWPLPAFLHYLYLGLSCLYVGRFEEGEKALSDAAESMSGDARPSAIADTQLANRMRTLALDEPARVPLALQEFVRETKANLRLE